MATDDTAKLILAYLRENQASAEVTHNDALNRLDFIIQLAINQWPVNDPPETPSNGLVVMVGVAGTGVFTGHDNEVAAYYDGWIFAEPQEGWRAWDCTADLLYVYDGTNWIEIAQAPAGVNVYFVGKHGNDSNDGLTWANAFLTFAVAESKAFLQTPSASKKFSIVCLDGGIYAESITLRSWISIHAPTAQINGNHIVRDNTFFEAQSNAVSSGSAFLKSTGAGRAIIDCKHVNLSGNAYGFNLTGGDLICRGRQINVGAGGVGIGFSTTGEIQFNYDLIEIDGAGYGVGASNSGKLSGYLGCIHDNGSGTGISLWGTSRTHIHVNDISCNLAYDVGQVGAKLYLSCPDINGTRLNNGTAVVNGEVNLRTTQTGIVASANQLQGQQPLTEEINEVATVNVINDVVTLPSAEAGRKIFIRNNGTRTLQIFPASGDRFDARAVNASVTLATVRHATFTAVNKTYWHTALETEL